MAHVVIEDGPTDTTFVVPVDGSGRFAFRLDEPGGYGMYAYGVHHQTLEIPFVLTTDERVELHMRLAANLSAAEGDSLQVLLASSDEGVEMQRQPDGTFAARVEVSADTLAYRIRYSAKVSEWSTDMLVEGTSQDRYVFNESDGFWDEEGYFFSVLDMQDEQFVDIVFDPSTLPHNAAEAAINSAPSLAADIISIYLDTKQRRQRIGEAMSRDENGYANIDFDAVRQVAAPIKERIGQEQDPLLRQWLILRYFDDLLLASDSTDKPLALQALETVTADSPFWSFEAWSSVGASNLLVRLARALDDQEAVRPYVQRVIDSHPDPDVRAQFLKVGVSMAISDEDEETKWLYYSMLQDSHADTEQAESVRRRFDPDRSLQAGNPVPEFSFVSFDDSTVTITDSGLRGRTYLLDFWGTWCAPCIEEIPALEEAYDRYKEAGFEILSVAFLDDRSDIEKFRKERHPMPWLHTRVAREDDSSVRKLFELTGFPRPILVDEEGIIVAIDAELRDGKVLDVVGAVYDGAE